VFLNSVSSVNVGEAATKNKAKFMLAPLWGGEKRNAKVK
jgi:hypothetical protein